MDGEERKIKIRAHQLCQQFSANQYTASDRNEKIIKILMEEFGIDRKYAEYCFMNNNRN